MFPGLVRGLVLVRVPCVSPDVTRERLNAKGPFEIAEDGSHLAYIWNRMQNEQYPGQLPKEMAHLHVYQTRTPLSQEPTMRKV